MTKVQCMRNSIFIEPSTGGYVQAGVQFVGISDGVNQLNLALLQPVNSWIYGTPQQGNPLLSLNTIATMEQVKQAITYVATPIIASGALISVNVKGYKLTLFKRVKIQLIVICPVYGEQSFTWEQPV